MKKELPEKRYYTIGEVSEHLGVNPSTVRFWERQFDFVNPKKNAQGTRRFSLEEVRKLETIYFLLKEQGYTIEGAKQKMKEQRYSLLSNVEIIHKLEAIKQILINLKKELK